MVLLIILVPVVLGATLVVLLVRRGVKTTSARLESQLATETVEMQAKANFYGVASAGRSQLRGLGMLAVTPTELVFFQALSDREVRVPRSAITEVTTVRGFLGKTQGRTLLKVTWRTDDATGTDEVAWDVPNYERWRTALSPAAPPSD